MKMMKNWIALLLALCMMAALGVASACCTEPTGMEEPQTMEETCACMMDGKGVDGCECMDGMCGDKCACGEGCKCAEKRLDMLAAEMNALFEKNMELWNKLFGMMSKQPDMSMTYADYLMEQLEAAREKFTQDEYKLLQQDIETIRRLDEEMSKLQEKMMPGDTMTMDPSMQDGMTVDGSMPMMEDDTAPKFPAFEGMDLDGNAVTSELFKDNSVTVINFWFSGCAPCIGELGELNTLNETLKLRGGAVIGVNTDTLGGDKRMINEAKKLLEKKGAAYQNIYFPEDSEAGVLAYSIMAFPTTVVVDRNGRLVGEPILGSINNEAQMKALQALIDEVLAKDMMTLDKDMMMKPDGN